jgi:hypothetical protein
MGRPGLKNGFGFKTIASEVVGNNNIDVVVIEDDDLILKVPNNDVDVILIDGHVNFEVCSK